MTVHYSPQQSMTVHNYTIFSCKHSPKEPNSIFHLLLVLNVKEIGIELITGGSDGSISVRIADSAVVSDARKKCRSMHN